MGVEMTEQTKATRGPRQVKVGTVVSNKMNQTVVVVVERPVVRYEETAKLEPGMVISLHPTATTKHASACIADTYVIGNSGAVPLYANLFEDDELPVVGRPVDGQQQRPASASGRFAAGSPKQGEPGPADSRGKQAQLV